jgi:hypothetical protein
MKQESRFRRVPKYWNCRMKKGQAHLRLASGEDKGEDGATAKEGRNQN